MNEPIKSWSESWFTNQQAMLKALLPTMPGSDSSSQSPSNPLQEQFAEMRDTWQSSVTKWTDHAKEAAKGEMPTPDALREMFSPASWSGPGSGVMDAALQRVLEGPRYATLWDLDRKLLELQKLTLQRDKDVAAYQAVVHKAWNLAFERFAKTSTAAPEPEGKLTWRSLADRWLAVANDTLIEVHRSEEFIEAQRRMLRAASELHLQERCIAEAWCEAMHVPTRSEVDEVQLAVTELRRELRLLRRATGPRATESATAAAATKVAATTASGRKPRAAPKHARP
jgi:polyhydroxyalkanoate synthase subunit PhaE